MLRKNKTSNLLGEHSQRTRNNNANLFFSLCALYHKRIMISGQRETQTGPVLNRQYNIRNKAAKSCGVLTDRILTVLSQL